MNNENQNMGGEASINQMNGMNVSTQLEPQMPNEPVNQQVAMMSAASVDSSAPLNIGVVNPLNGAVEIPVEEEEEEEVEKPSKTAAELDLERRNKSGLRFIIIFGLLVLIFIILLPFLITIF